LSNHRLTPVASGLPPLRRSESIILHVRRDEIPGGFDSENSYRCVNGTQAGKQVRRVSISETVFISVRLGELLFRDCRLRER